MANLSQLKDLLTPGFREWIGSQVAIAAYPAPEDFWMEVVERPEPGIAMIVHLSNGISTRSFMSEAEIDERLGGCSFEPLGRLFKDRMQSLVPHYIFPDENVIGYDC